MASRRGPPTGTGMVVEHLKRKGVDVGAGPPEPAYDNLAICGLFGIKKPTLVRWRSTRGFPEADFVIGLREFTWRSRIMDWIDQQPKTHPMKGRRLGASGATEAA